MPKARDLGKKEKDIKLFRGAVRMIAARSGVPTSTLHAVLQGQRKTPAAREAIIDFCNLNKLPIPTILNHN